MIYIKTSLKKVPACCTKCKYSSVFGRGLDTVRYCRLTDIPAPQERTANGNWKYTKPKNCPLVDAREGDS